MSDHDSSVNGKNQLSNDCEQYLTFMLGNKTYGLQILNIKEIIEYGDVTEVPMTPDFISGVINLRGAVVPVVDLRQRFSGEACELTKRTSIVILEVKDSDLRIEIGITVDMVNEVLEINNENIEPPPSLGEQITTNFISGMAKLNNQLLILLNIENILTVSEVSAVGKIQTTSEQEHQEHETEEQRREQLSEEENPSIIE